MSNYTTLINTWENPMAGEDDMFAECPDCGKTHNDRTALGAIKKADGCCSLE